MRQVEEETLRKASAHGGLAGDGALQRVGGLVRLHFDEDGVASHVAGGHGHLHLVHVLASLGYDVAADGDFGPATAEAIKSFQSSRGLEADGLVGPSTYSALMGRSMPQVSRSSNHISRRVVANSMNYLGVPYVFGGTSPSGFDCSGYVRYVFANAGIYLPRTADAQYEVGMPISRSELVPGDLVFFSTYEYGPSHVGIYLGAAEWRGKYDSYRQGRPYWPVP